MSENKATEATGGTVAFDETGQGEVTEEQTQDKKPRRSRKPKPKMVTIKGRIATTELAAGDVVEVERTPVIDKLLKAGFVEEVKG